MKHIKRISIWGRLIGNVVILYGIVVMLQGLLSSIIGALPGILAIFIGKYLHDSGTEAKELLRFNGKNVAAVDLVMKQISKFLLLIGILMFIVIIFYALFLIIALMY